MRLNGKANVIGTTMELTKRFLLVLYLQALGKSLCRYKRICRSVHKMAGIFEVRTAVLVHGSEWHGGPLSLGNRVGSIFYWTMDRYKWR